jgi:hypothetical protein
MCYHKVTTKKERRKMKMQESKHFYKILEVEGYVNLEEWKEIKQYFNEPVNRQLNTLDLSKVTNISIPEKAFESCVTLQEVVLPENLVTVGASAFANCNSLRRAVMPKTLKTIEAHAFENCNLQQFHAPKALEVLGSDALKGNSAIEKMAKTKPALER